MTCDCDRSACVCGIVTTPLASRATEPPPAPPVDDIREALECLMCAVEDGNPEELAMEATLAARALGWVCPECRGDGALSHVVDAGSQHCDPANVIERECETCGGRGWAPR